MRWRLLLEEFGPELIYIKGEKNIVADALSRLPIEADDETLELHTFEEAALYNSEAVGEQKFEYYPLRFKTILKHQKEDEELMKAAHENVTNKYHFKTFCGGQEEILPPLSLMKNFNSKNSSKENCSMVSCHLTASW